MFSVIKNESGKVATPIGVDTMSLLSLFCSLLAGGGLAFLPWGGCWRSPAPSPWGEGKPRAKDHPRQPAEVLTHAT